MERNEAARKRLEEVSSHRREGAKEVSRSEKRNLSFLDSLGGSDDIKRLRKSDRQSYQRRRRAYNRISFPNDEGEYLTGPLSGGEGRTYSRAKMAALKKKIAQRKKDK
jgi:hypothetical protein